MNSMDILNATSSQESADGPLPSPSLAGQPLDLFGQALAPASRSAMQAKAKGSKIPAISGQRGFGSSESAALQRSLENKLRAQMDLHGSTTYRLTWSRRLTQSGRRIFQLRASALHKDGQGSGSWQTPTTRDGKGQSGMGNRIKRGKNGRLHVANLCDQIVDLGRPDLVRSPEFRCWLMGYPECWDDAGATAMQSLRKSRRSSSAPLSKSNTLLDRP
jgi:hypothetical protein